MELLKELGINVPSLVAQLVAFFILFGALYFFAFKPFLKTLDDRSKRIKDSVDNAEKIKESALKAEEESRKRIDAAAKEGQEIVARASKTGEDARIRAQQEARKDAEALIARAQSEIQSERDAALAELRRAFSELTVAVAGKVIDRSLDKKAHEELIEKMLKENPTFKG